MIRRTLAFVFIPLLVAGACFLVGRTLLDSPASPVTAGLPLGLPQASPERALDAGKPRFEGELLGIYLGPTEALIAKGIQIDVSKACPSGFTFVADTAYAPPVPKYVPAGATQPAEYVPFGAVPNPGAAVCQDDGRPYTAWRYYTVPGADGPPGEILIVRVTLARPYRMVDAPADLVGIVSVGGRAAILVEPATQDSAAASTTVLFPEATGYLEVQGLAVPSAQVMKVAQSIAEALP